MKSNQSSTVAPSPVWSVPATTWPDIVGRYVSFVQVPSWRATVKADGSEKSGCLEPDAAHRLSVGMSRVVEAMARRRGTPSTRLRARIEDLAELAGLVSRNVARVDRCPAKLHWHFQRAYLLNNTGYRCEYCHRTAFGVFGEAVGTESRRTLRFEIDHRITRRRLKNARQFDANNLVAACRSCNTIKGEMSEERFLRELESLAVGFVRSRGLSGVGPS